MWVFGYGSLVWKVDFPYEARVPGHLRGFVRRFWQGSHDHRGTGEKPGRVCTLLPYDEWVTFAEEDPHHPASMQEAVVWGIAYKIHANDVESVRKHLDHREKNGYSSFMAPVYHPKVSETTPIVPEAMVYVATSDNEAFLGPAPMEALAKHIATSEGPSGLNCDYLFGLAMAMRALYPDVRDPHLFELEQRVNDMLPNKPHADGRLGQVNLDAIDHLKTLGKLDPRKAMHSALGTLHSSAAPARQ